MRSGFQKQSKAINWKLFLNSPGHSVLRFDGLQIRKAKKPEIDYQLMIYVSSVQAISIFCLPLSICKEEWETTVTEVPLSIFSMT